MHEVRHVTRAPAQARPVVSSRSSSVGADRLGGGEGRPGGRRGTFEQSRGVTECCGSLPMARSNCLVKVEG